MTTGLTTEMEIAIWGVIAQWVAMLGSGVAYYLIRIRHDIRWKADMENRMSDLTSRVAGLERKRRKDDRFQTREACQEDKQSCIQITEKATMEMSRRISDIQDRLEQMRKQSEADRERRQDKIEQISAEISSLKETMSALMASQRDTTRSIDRLMDHFFSSGGQHERV